MFLYLLRVLVLASAASTKQHHWSWDHILTDYNRTGGKYLATAALPLFHMGIMPPNQKPCYPGWAITADGRQAEPTEAQPWPQFDGLHCPDPGPPNTRKSAQFPVYFTVKVCNNTEVRVGYYVYFAKDGYAPFNASGHWHDFERVVIQWKRRPDGSLYRQKMGFSAHGQLHVKTWKTDLITFNAYGESQATEPGGDNDHPKVYIGTVKHQMFPDMLKNCTEPGSEKGEGEYRSDDWQMMPNKENLINAAPGSIYGSKIASFNYGIADGTPSALFSTLCTVLF